MSECYFCPESDRLEEHHIVPRRFDGSDTAENVVTVCPTCHSKLESLYDKRFYDALGVRRDSSVETQQNYECSYGECTADSTHHYPYNDDMLLAVCDDHNKCGKCGNKPHTAIGPHQNADCGMGVRLRCNDHATCQYGGCRNREIRLYEDYVGGTEQLCESHAMKMGRVHNDE